MKKKAFNKSGKLILGINGWMENGHDASACLVEVDSNRCEVLGALEEEKITKQKCSYNVLPTQSIHYLLEYYSLSPADIDYIAFGWNYPHMYEVNNTEFPFNNNQEILKALFQGATIDKEIEIVYIGHHLAHAASSFRTSQFNTCLTFVFDGQGEQESSSVWVAENGELEKISYSGIKESLGYLYEAVNEVLGFKNHESGKTMGLASYGKPIFINDFKQALILEEDKLLLNDKLERIYQVVSRFTEKNTNEQANVITMWKHFIKEELGIEDNHKNVNSFYEIEDIYKNLAASVQNLLEEYVVQIVNYYINKTKINKICMSGGVALNCIMNGRILEEQNVEEIYINPAANDAGVSLGAALELAYKLGYPSHLNKPFFDPFIGIEYSNEEIIEELKSNELKYQITENAQEVIANLISNEKVVALFQGRNEWGPRALGNRSIISSPRDKDRLDYINTSIKHRETGRPLGPSMLQEDASKLLVNETKFLGKYMNIAYNSQAIKSEFPAIIHVDHTFRPEFVDPDFNVIYYKQLKTIKEITGSSIVINTSFNLKTPIIFHIQDAIDYFVNSKLDALIFNNQIVLTK
ncbi:carbamoyltransferase C-terminal domain-containing protein [Paenibacillus wenxiniae]|uniref:Carbamoyltransferase C-terminal domain-containing protein n=1 Tax=Paenibacillus wenxiniae TaxID=1636843 RepID=A0ABW4RMY2_9BACL